MTRRKSLESWLMQTRNEYQIESEKRAEGREIAKEGRLRSGTGESAAQVLWGACHGVVSLLITMPDRAWSNADELMKVTLDGLLYGLVTD